jgi:hypothetical protein
MAILTPHFASGGEETSALEAFLIKCSRSTTKRIFQLLVINLHLWLKQTNREERDQATLILLTSFSYLKVPNDSAE